MEVKNVEIKALEVTAGNLASTNAWLSQAPINWDYYKSIEFAQLIDFDNDSQESLSDRWKAYAEDDERPSLARVEYVFNGGRTATQYICLGDYVAVNNGRVYVIYPGKLHAWLEEKV